VGIIFDVFKDSTAKPSGSFYAGVLGETHWSGDDESWVGSFSGIEFLIGYDPSSSEPVDAVLRYATSILCDSAWLRKTVEDEKRKYVERNPDFEGELKELAIDNVHFYIRKGVRHMLCQLGCGDPDRFWSLDFRGRRCTGMGFDA
jgi:hypothetical protein